MPSRASAAKTVLYRMLVRRKRLGDWRRVTPVSLEFIIHCVGSADAPHVHDCDPVTDLRGRQRYGPVTRWKMHGAAAAGYFCDYGGSYLALPKQGILLEKNVVVYLRL